MKIVLRSIIYLISVIIISCSHKSESFVVADYNGHVIINSSGPQLFASLAGNNYIHTDASSYCVIQHGDSGLLIIYSNSDVNIDYNVTGDNSKIIISIPKGIVDILYSSSLKDVIIKTDTCLMTGNVKILRLLSHENYTCVMNKDAKVTVEYVENGTQYSKFIEKNKMFITTGQMSGYYDLAVQTVDLFNELSHIHYGNAGENKPVIIPPALKEMIRVFGNRNIKDDITLALLERQKGALKKVITRSGVVYRGYVTAKGKLLEILTYEGVISIPQSSVKYVLSYQPMYDNQ